MTRIRVSIVLSLVLPALFAIDACSVNWDNPESQTVDEMFAGDYGSVNGVSPFPSSPQASRALQAGEPSKEIIGLPIGGNHSAVATTSQLANSQDQNQMITQPVVTNVIAPNQARPTSASGTWSLEMADTISRNVTMTLFQSGDAVFGKGEIREDNNTILTAAASGSVAANELTLDLVSLDKIELYRLSLIVSGDSLTGNYTAFSIIEAPLTGIVRGFRTVAPT
jgi:hypothetical protein